MTKKANEFQVTSKINLRKTPTALTPKKGDKK
jgi:hypothetical protein